MSKLRQIQLPNFGGQNEGLPPLPIEEHLARLGSAVGAMEQGGFDVLAVYGDREHFANLCYLTGFDPRFEEALLLLDRAGRRRLLVGNECMGYLPDGRLGCQAELFQEFSLLGQPRGNSRPLRTILADFGVRGGCRVGCVGWKYFQGANVEGAGRAIDLPAYIADLLRDLAGADAVQNATALLMGNAGLRAVNSADQIAQLEYAAIRTSRSVLAAMRKLKPGVAETTLENQFRTGGLPLNCHTMISVGEKTKRGLSSPSARKARLGDPYQIAQGLYGSLTCRAGAVARGPEDLPPALRDFFPRLAANYFDVVVRWYESLRLGAMGGEVFAAVDSVRDKELYEFAVNPGHLIHLDEWLNSPFAAGSAEPLVSGMAIQMDIIPISRGPYCYVNAEDGIVLADESLRGQIARLHPRCWKRMLARRQFMAERLGIRLDPCVLPLSNFPAWLPPYVMNLQLAFATRDI